MFTYRKWAGLNCNLQRAYSNLFKILKNSPIWFQACSLEVVHDRRWTHNVPFLRSDHISLLGKPHKWSYSNSQNVKGIAI